MSLINYKEFRYGETIRNILKPMPREIRNEFREAIEDYGIDFIEPNFSGDWAKEAAWEGIKTCIDNCRSKRGAPIGNENAKNKSQSYSQEADEPAKEPQFIAPGKPEFVEKVEQGEKVFEKVDVENQLKTNNLIEFQLKQMENKSPKEKEKEKEKENEKFKESREDARVDSSNFSKQQSYSQKTDEPAKEPQEFERGKPELVDVLREHSPPEGFDGGSAGISAPPKTKHSEPPSKPLGVVGASPPHDSGGFAPDTSQNIRSPPLASQSIHALWDELRAEWNAHNVQFTADKIFANLSYAQKDRIVGTLKTYTRDQLLGGIRAYFAENPKKYVYSSIYLFFEKGIEFYVGG